MLCNDFQAVLLMAVKIKCIVLKLLEIYLLVKKFADNIYFLTNILMYYTQTINGDLSRLTEI